MRPGGSGPAVHYLSRYREFDGIDLSNAAATAQRLPALVADLRLVTVEGGPHNIAWTHSDEVNKPLLEFLAD